MKNATTLCSLMVLSLLCGHAQAQGQYTISDNFTGATSSLQWYTFGGACLTAGSGSWTGTNGPNYLPGCSVSSTNNYYTQQGVSLSSLGGGYNGSMPDTAGNGAMRLTNNSNYETGAIVSNNTMSTGSGLNISFVTTTYGGTGADGMTFFLMDGSKTPTPSYNGNSVGASGGSLGYSCSNGNPVFDGVYGAYVGVGMDEFGNFQNGGSSADNTNSGYGFHPNTVGVRGAGNISWKWLNANWPSYYPSTLTASQVANVVHLTCANNTLYNAGGSHASNPVAVSTSTAALPAYSDYALLPLQSGSYFPTLPSTMWSSTGSRSSATPIAYQVIITPDNKLSVYYSFNGGTPQTVLNNLSITASNGPIPSTLRFGFAGSTGGSNNMHEVSCFKAQPQSQSSSSIGTSAPNSGNLQTNTQEYQATYSAVNWLGHFSSYGLNYNNTTNILSFNTSATWDASCVLTGNVGPQNAASSGTCYNTGAALTTPPTPATGRVMLTSNWSTSTNASVGTAFQAGSIAPAQLAGLGSSNKLAYLRGDRSLEQVSSNGTTTGTYRARTDGNGKSNVLGDIMDSSAALLTYPQAPYLGIWTDYLNNALKTPVALLENASGAQTYAAYVKAQQTRQNVVFIGSNDGFLHGFSAGAYNSSGTFQTATNTGQELVAYMPGNVLNAYSTNSGTVGDFSNPTYSHVYSADGQPTVGDLFYNKAWHTWLVSGQGPGGSAIFALDVTNPGNFAETNAASLVLGEWNASTITCVGNTTCGTHLGNTYGTPQIRRFHSNQWGFIFGNGFGSAGYTAGIYIGLVDGSSGAVTFYYLDTGKGSSSSPNGIAYVTPADLDGDHVVDYVYAGDLLGNVWRFDLTNASPSSWKTSTYNNGSTPTPLFTTPTSTGTVTKNGVQTTVTYTQPITTAVTVPMVPSSLGPYTRVLVDFGTGQRTVQNATSAATYQSGQQSLYGIWDWDMTSWNTQNPSTTLQTLSASTNTITTSKLQVQTLTSTTLSVPTNGVSGTRTVSNNTICWNGTTGCSPGQFGWYINLPSSTNEQVIYSPVLFQGAVFVVNTTVPSGNSLLNCQSNLDSGWSLALASDTGGVLQQSAFNQVATTTSLVGLQLSAVGSPSFINAYGRNFMINNTSSGIGNVQNPSFLFPRFGQRVNWQQLR